MKRLIVVGFCLFFSLHSFANEKAELAAAAYAKRDFTADGVKKAQEATTLYAEAVAAETDPVMQLTLMQELATAHYFLGTAMSNKDDRKVQHQVAMDLNDQVMIRLGVQPDLAPELTDAQINSISNNLSAREELLLADAMYSKGINLAQWGNLNGIASSIGELPVVLGLMERVEMLGYADIHEYGPYRTIGRIKFMLPAILGGDLVDSERYLKDAFRKTLVEGQRYSLNAYNNIYLAETLYKKGKETQAIRLLEMFVAADPSTLKANHEPENAEALKTAEALLNDWK
jgi:hypothetical protein